jgi:hypothetical protein
MWDRRQAYRILVGRPEEKRYHFERPIKGKFVPLNATEAHRETQTTAALTYASDRYT